MKIILVNPPVINIKEPLHDTPDYLNLGLSHLYSTLRKFTKHEIRFLDCKFLRKDHEWLLKRLRKEKPDLLGFTSKTLEIDNVLNLCRKIKKNINCRIIIGGPHATGNADYIIKEKSIDFVGISEFETGMLELVKFMERGGEDFSEVPSLVWKTAGKIIRNPVSYSEEKDIVSVLWEELPKASRYYIMALRGCPQRCIFCMRVLGDRVRYRNVKDVCDEIQNILNRNPEADIEFGDETFTVSRKYLLDLKKELLKRHILLHSLTASTRIDRLDTDIVDILKNIGFKKLIVGIESGDKRVLSLTRKDIDIDKALSVSRLIRKAGIRLECNYMVGLPGENLVSIIKTALISARLRADSISVSIACPYPGTELYTMCEQQKFGLRLLSGDFSEYNNELGNAMEHERLSRKVLEIAQLFIYVFSFIGSFRFREFLLFSLRFRKEALSFIKNFLK